MILQAILDTLQNTFNWGGFIDMMKFTDIFLGATDCTREVDSTCPASSFNVITAAFATQGYWIQADILDYFQGGMGTLAILIYVLAAIAGIFSMAMGAPPKMYGWFFMGPYIFYWLTETTTPDTSVDGVRVMMGKPGGEFFSQGAASNEQQKVWRYAQVGLEGMNIFKRKECSFDEDNGFKPSCSFKEEDEVGDGAVNPAYFFVKFDALVSDIVEQMIDWTGVYYINADEEQDLSQGRNGTISPDHLVSNMKWGILEDITSAKLASPEVRDLFVNFLSSECGDGFAQGINPQKFVAANSARNGYLPDFIFYQGGVGKNSEYDTLRQVLQDKAIPKPRSVTKLLNYRTMESPGSFLKSVSESDTNFEQVSRLYGNDTVHCLDLLQLVVLTFRWQAASLYYQLLTNTPPGMPPGRMLKNFLYGWPIARELADEGGLASDESVQEFFINLILVHLFRNEFSIAPQPMNKVNTASKENIQFSEAYQRTVGQKTKFSELYTWALMTPYLQGVLLYLLALSYPFVCMMMIIPGWHKILGTWCSFWIWVKLWDLGFAVVTVLERSVWSIIGNDYDATVQLKELLKLKQWGTHTIACRGAGSDVLSRLCSSDEPIPDVMLSFGSFSFGSFEVFLDLIRRLDKLMILGASLNLDLANSYYIYVMAALYFAVPAVLGQVVLGAKAGAAGLATNAFSQVASEVGRSSGSGYSADLGKRAEQAAAQAKQTFTAKSMRGAGAASQNVIDALEQGNKGLDRELQAGFLGETAHGLSRASRVQSLAIGEWKDAMSTATGLSQDEQSRYGTQFTMIGRATAPFNGEKNQAQPQTTQPTATAPVPARQGISPAQQDDNALRTVANTALQSVRALGVRGFVGVTGSAAYIAADNQSLKSTQLGAQQRYAGFLFGQAERTYQARAEAAQSQANIAGWAAGSMGKGFGDSSRTQAEVAEQVSSDVVADQMTRVAHQTAGILGAQGVSNPYSISRNANMKAMAALGWLGKNNKERALYSKDGYQEKVRGYSDVLTKSFGRQNLDGMFKNVNLQQGNDQRVALWQSAASSSSDNIQRRIGDGDGIDWGTFENNDFINFSSNPTSTPFATTDYKSSLPPIASPALTSTPKEP